MLGKIFDGIRKRERERERVKIIFSGILNKLKSIII